MGFDSTGHAKNKWNKERECVCVYVRDKVGGIQSFISKEHTEKEKECIGKEKRGET